jgi:hypothetical protein
MRARDDTPDTADPPPRARSLLSQTVAVQAQTSNTQSSLQQSLLKLQAAPDGAHASPVLESPPDALAESPPDALAESPPDALAESPPVELPPEVHTFQAAATQAVAEFMLALVASMLAHTHLPSLVQFCPADTPRLEQRAMHSLVAQARFELARALWLAYRDRDRARTLAREAAQTYREQPGGDRFRVEVEAWLAAH